MKLFAIIYTPGGIFIRRTDGSQRIPAQIILAQADTYEEAVLTRDKFRNEQEERRGQLDNKWHDQFDRAMADGNGERLNYLCGIRY